MCIRDRVNDVAAAGQRENFYTHYNYRKSKVDPLLCTVGKGRVGSDLVKPFEYVRAKRARRLICRQISVGDIGVKAVFLVKAVSDLYKVSPHVLRAYGVPVKKRNAVAQIFPHLVDVQGSRCALCPHIELSAVLSVCRPKCAEHIFKLGLVRRPLNFDVVHKLIKPGKLCLLYTSRCV